MSEWLDNQKQISDNFRKFLQEQIENSNPRRKLTTEETKRLAKLEAIIDKLKRGENVQNRQLQKGVSIGGGATILPGIKIGHGALIGAGAVVTKDVKPETVVFGLGAKEMRSIKKPS